VPLSLEWIPRSMSETAEHEETLAKDEREIASSPPVTQPPQRMLAFALVLVVILLFAGIRWRLREMPLERDEGEYAYAGQLMLQGIPPYQIVYNMKLPGTYLVYAAILRMFGETATGIHLGLLLANGCTTLMMFFVGRRLYGGLAGVTAAASYGLLSTSEAVLGLAGHATHFVVLIAVAGLLVLLAARESKKLTAYFAAGLCMGLAFVMKQPGMVFVIFGAQQVAWSNWKEWSREKKVATRLLVYGLGAALPYLLTCAVLYRAGVFGKFWFWTVTYASQYATRTGLAEGMVYLGTSVPQLFFAAPVVWCFAAVALGKIVIEQGIPSVLRFEVGLLLWSFVGVSAGLYYRDHYFILMLPAVSVLAGKAVKWSTEQIAKRMQIKRAISIPAAIFAAGFAWAIFAQRGIFFEMSAPGVIRHEYGGNPFPEAIEIGKYIREHSTPEARIAVLGSEPEIYFYAQRHSATGYIYTYGLMEEQKYATQMQQEMMGEIENARPEYLVKVMVAASWLRKPNSDLSILYWMDRYIGDHYRAVAVADIGLTTTYRWDTQAEGYRSPARYSVYVYKRKI
jgi:Dolichyl-phosphate-mannose-protein mannosyltransferase